MQNGKQWRTGFISLFWIYGYMVHNEMQTRVIEIIFEFLLLIIGLNSQLFGKVLLNAIFGALLVLQMN